MTQEIVSDQWMAMKDQRGPDGFLTPLALALDALEDNGCDCGGGEKGSCLSCLCEAALLDLWERGNGTAEMVARLTEDAVSECMGDPRIAALLERSSIPAAFLLWLDAEIEASRQLSGRDPQSMHFYTLKRVKARLCRPGEPHNGGIRGVTFPCENCGAQIGCFLDNGFNRCGACGYPGK